MYSKGQNVRYQEEKSYPRKKEEGPFSKVLCLFVVGSVMSSVVIAMNMDSDFLANKNNAVVYIPQKMSTDVDNPLPVITTNRRGNLLPNKHVSVALEDENVARTIYEGSMDEAVSLTPAFRVEWEWDQATLPVTARSERISRRVSVDSTTGIHYPRIN